MARYFPMGKISIIHGQPGWIKGRLVVPMFHPAAALHQAQLRPTLEQDFSRLSEWLNQVKQRQSTMAEPSHFAGKTAEPLRPSAINEKSNPAGETDPPKEQPTQLSLF